MVDLLRLYDHYTSVCFAASAKSLDKYKYARHKALNSCNRVAKKVHGRLRMSSWIEEIVTEIKGIEHRGPHTVRVDLKPTYGMPPNRNS